MSVSAETAAARAFEQVMTAACRRDHLSPRGTSPDVFTFDVTAAGRSYSVSYFRSGEFQTTCTTVVPAGMMDGLDVASLNRRIAPNRIEPHGPVDGHYGFFLREPFPPGGLAGSLRAVLLAKAENAATFDAAMREMGF